ncbi:SUMF1/EgtB/PvdO family nonheme iron enzyme, partial [Candidatus Sumerlaeota bacterium]|nr:SUMF1/EgtB/PvdO family nonheme iron enzyme [Candidatus Sumerlaeota bacterium]
GMEANVRYVDRVIGRLVETLKDAGVWENTVLMVGGDNPSPTLGKGYAAVIGAHVPLIVAGGKKWVTWQGETGCLTDFADVYPTCMELAGLDPATNPELSGKSLKPLLDGDRAYTRPWIFSYLGIYRMIRDHQWCLDGLDQLWRCNKSGNPFTFELIPKDKEDAQAARGRAALEAILKALPPVPDSVMAANAQFAANREANRAGNLSPVQRFQQLYRMGLEKLMAMPTRKEGPTRAQIAARLQSASQKQPMPDRQPPARPRTAEGDTPIGKLGKAGGVGAWQERFDQMAATLGLSDEQKNKLMELQRAQYQQMGGLGGLGEPGQFKKFRAALEQKVKESKILTDEQFAKWKEFQSQRFTGGGKTSGGRTMPKRTSPAPEKPAQPEAPKPKPAVAPASVTSPASVKPVGNMVWIQPGTFAQGTAKGADAEAYPDEYPQREVTISKGFWMGKFEVTQKEYLAIMGTNCSFFDGTPRTSKRSAKTFDFGGPNLERPVDSVSWSNAVRYCALLTERERAAGRIPATWRYRLPTEAEWDYAIRAGTTTRYYFGDDPDHTLIKEYEWVGVNKRGQDPNTGTAPTQPVGQLKPNPWDLYDMGGNVWEWTLDHYAQFPRSGNAVVDPLSTRSDLQPKHALKGCGANSPPRWARSAARGYDPLDNKGPLHELDLPHTNNYTDHWVPTGFRIVLSEVVYGDGVTVAQSPPSQAPAAWPLILSPPFEWSVRSPSYWLADRSSCRRNFSDTFRRSI